MSNWVQRMADADPAMIILSIAVYFLLWAVFTIWMIKRREPKWEDTASTIFFYGLIYQFVLCMTVVFLQEVCDYFC